MSCTLAVGRLVILTQKLCGDSRVPYHFCKATLLKERFVSKVIHRHMATIYATPSTTLVDEKVKINLSGLDPGSKVTVRSHLPEPGLIFEAHGHFVVNGNGEVSMEKDPSLGGTYTDIEPMGLIWSMVQSPGQRVGLRFAKRDITMPMDLTLSVHKGHLDISTLQNDAPIAQTHISRNYMGPDVEVVKVHSGRVRGRVFKPKGPGPFKGVIDMFGSAGGLIEFRAALLASRGFAAYALPFFRYEDLPETMFELDLDYFEEATDWLLKQPYVEPGSIGVTAVSWGAEIATMMATSFPEKIGACVSISGSSLRTWAPIAYSKRDYTPYLQFNLERLRKVREDDNGAVVMNTYEVPDPLEEAPSEAFIELERAQHLLFFVGLDDKNWATPIFIDAAERRLKALGCSNYEIVRYPKAGHLIEPPYAPVTLESYHGLIGNIIEWGGSAREHNRAQEDHWPKLLNFLNTYVGIQPSFPGQSSVNSKL